MSAGQSMATLVASALLIGCATAPPPEPERVVATWYATETADQVEIRLLLASRAVEPLWIHGVYINPRSGVSREEWWVLNDPVGCGMTQAKWMYPAMRLGELWVERIDGSHACHVTVAEGRFEVTEGFPVCAIPARVELVVRRPPQERARRDHKCITRSAATLGDDYECVVVDVRAALPSALPESWKHACGTKSP